MRHLIRHVANRSIGLLTDQEFQNVSDSCHSENIDGRDRVQVGLDEKRKGRETEAEICQSLSNIEHQSCTSRRKVDPPRCPKTLTTPNKSGTARSASTLAHMSRSSRTSFWDARA